MTETRVIGQSQMEVARIILVSMSGNKKYYKKNITRSVLKGSAPALLENFLFPEGLPEYFPSFRDSPELLTIFHLLFSLGYNSEVAALDGFDIAADTSGALEERMRLIIGADTRSLLTYKCFQDFRLIGMEFTPMAELPLYQTPSKAREVKKGDLLIIRRDTEIFNRRGTAELQILTNGLFNSVDDDWRVFTGTLVDISQITKYSTLEKEGKAVGTYETRKNNTTRGPNKGRT